MASIRKKFNKLVEEDSPEAFDLLPKVKPYVYTIECAIRKDRKIAEAICATDLVNHKTINFAIFHGKVHLVKIMMEHVRAIDIPPDIARGLIRNGSLDDVKEVNELIPIKFDASCIRQAIISDKLDILEFLCQTVVPTSSCYYAGIINSNIKAIEIMEPYRKWKLTKSFLDYSCAGLPIDIITYAVEVLKAPISFEFIECLMRNKRLDVIKYIHKNKLTTSHKCLLESTSSQKNVDDILNYLYNEFFKDRELDFNRVLFNLLQNKNKHHAELYVDRHSSSKICYRVIDLAVRLDYATFLNKYIQKCHCWDLAVVLSGIISDDVKPSIGKILYTRFENASISILPTKAKGFIESLSKFK
jgi:hypothetical protein